MSDDPIDWARLNRIVWCAGLHFRHANDWDDLRQEGLLVAWQHHALPDSLLTVIVRRRMIDAIRKWHGRTRWSYGDEERPQREVPLGRADLVDRDEVTGRERGSFDPGSCAGPEVDAVSAYGFRGRLALIVEALEAGESKQSIAERLGVHPSRVSQLLREVRRVMLLAEREHA